MISATQSTFGASAVNVRSTRSELAAPITHCCDRKLAAADTSNARVAHEPRDTVLPTCTPSAASSTWTPRCTIGSARDTAWIVRTVSGNAVFERARREGERARPRMYPLDERPSTRHMVAIGNRPARAHESEPFGGITSVSPANQAAAFERMSRSSLSCLTSRRRRLISSRSSVVTRHPDGPRPAQPARPIPDRLRRRLELLRQALRTSPGPNQLDHLTPNSGV